MSVDNIEKAKKFYVDTFGVKTQNEMGGQMFGIQLPGNQNVFFYQKDDHKPASYTTLNVQVEDIEATVDELKEKDIEFIRYPDMQQDERGIMRGQDIGMGPNIAWFKDPAGNVLAILEHTGDMHSKQEEE